MSASNETHVRREVDLLRKLSHPNIVKLRDSFEFSKGIEQYVVLVMAVADSTLDKSLPMPDSYDRFLCMLQLTNAVTWLHSKDVMHRDIKPANILRLRIKASEGPDPAASTVWQLADFGLGKQVAVGAASAQHTNCGTPQYEAPEVRSGEKYSARADVYSLVVVLCEVWASEKTRCRPQTAEFKKHWDVEPFKSFWEKRETENVIGKFKSQAQGRLNMSELSRQVIWNEVPSLIVSLMLNPGLGFVSLVWRVPNMYLAISSRPELVSCLLSQGELFTVDFVLQNVPRYQSMLAEAVLRSRFCTPYSFLLHQKQALPAQKWLVDLASKFFCAEHPKGPTSQSTKQHQESWGSCIGAFQKALGTSATAILRDRLLEVNPHAGEWFAEHREAVGLPETDD